MLFHNLFLIVFVTFPLGSLLSYFLPFLLPFFINFLSIIFLLSCVPPFLQLKSLACLYDFSLVSLMLPPVLACLCYLSFGSFLLLPPLRLYANNSFFFTSLHRVQYIFLSMMLLPLLQGGMKYGRKEKNKEGDWKMEESKE